MSVVRYSLFATGIITALLGAELAACSSDDANPAHSPSDAGTSDGEPLVDSGAFSAPRVKVYLGQRATLDGAALLPEDATNLSWELLVAPSNSGLATASLTEATGPTTSFVPDVLGPYLVQVSGTRDGAPAEAIVVVEALDVPVFWREGTVDAEITGVFVNESTEIIEQRSSTHVGGVYGAMPDRELVCPSARVAPHEFNMGAYGPTNVRYSASAGDTWEGPPGTPSRLVYPEMLEEGTDSVVASLVAVTSESSCAANDAKTLVSMPASESKAFFSARFSPDGARVAYVYNDADGKGRIASIGFDGTAQRDLSPFESGGGATGLDPNAPVFEARRLFYDQYWTGPVHPRWKDGSHVGWIAFVGPTSQAAARELAPPTEWELWVVEDRAGATPELVMHCTSSALTSFDFAADGSIIAATRHPIENGEVESMTMNLLVYRADATKECEVVRNLTNNVASDALARDLALSPDRSTVAFLAGVERYPAPAPNRHDLRQERLELGLSTVPVDGSRPPAKVPGSSRAMFGMGPRWIGGGTLLSWGSSVSASITYVASVHAIPPEGGTERLVRQGWLENIVMPDGEWGFRAHSYAPIGQGCRFSRARTDGQAAALALGLVLGALGLRRRRNARSEVVVRRASTREDAS